MSANKRIKSESSTGIPSTVLGFKQSSVYIIESLLTPYDYILPGTDPIGLFNGQEIIYARTNVLTLKSKHSWKTSHNRQILQDQKPVRVISRDVGGVQRTIDLFSIDQTEPLENLVASLERGIPANEYGNVEIDRVPENAILVESSDINIAIRACKSIPGLAWCKCQNGWKRRQPVFAGVVVLVQDQERVRTAIHELESLSEEKEKKARDDAALAIWRTLLRAIKAEYYIRTVIDKPS